MGGIKKGNIYYDTVTGDFYKSYSDGTVRISGEDIQADFITDKICLEIGNGIYVDINTMTDLYEWEIDEHVVINSKQFNKIEI